MATTTFHPNFNFILISMLTLDKVIQAAILQEEDKASLDAVTTMPAGTESVTTAGTLASNSEVTWCYSIDGVSGRGSFETKQQAILAAEEALFGEYKAWADEYLLQAIQANDIHTALALVERRGFHEGRAHARQQAAKLIKRTWTQLEPLSRY